ncbi:MFS transporter [Nocardioides convexus]|uniref:MFS transporter n=1 Tax=Nocardioides convexus TaxID=2712224 RepID=UPI002418A2C4|nr:MFS transporter [Nocardioides convexus]
MAAIVATTQRPPSTRRAILNTVRGSLGNLVEWYDVYVYTVFASYFESHFFGGDEPNAGVYTMAIFAVTFLMRPIGSWYFGRFADRHGRRPALVFSVSLMATASLVIAVAPTAATVGSGAIVILVLCRLLQGFATGGEYGTSATYMSEAATPERRGFFSSFQYVTLVGGHVLAQAHAAAPAGLPQRRADQRLRLADRVRLRRRRRGRRALAALLDGRVAAGRGRRGCPPLRLDARAC